MPTQKPRSVLQRAKDRTKDLDAAIGAMEQGDAPPAIGGAIAPPAPRAPRAAPVAPAARAPSKSTRSKRR